MIIRSRNFQLRSFALQSALILQPDLSMILNAVVSARVVVSSDFASP